MLQTSLNTCYSHKLSPKSNAAGLRVYSTPCSTPLALRKSTHASIPRSQGASLRTPVCLTGKHQNATSRAPVRVAASAGGARREQRAKAEHACKCTSFPEQALIARLELTLPTLLASVYTVVTWDEELLMTLNDCDAARRGFRGRTTIDGSPRNKGPIPQHYPSSASRNLHRCQVGQVSHLVPWLCWQQGWLCVPQDGQGSCSKENQLVEV
eukprot:1158422-Pelagomonas_calceolata.AAC.1